MVKLKKIKVCAFQQGCYYGTTLHRYLSPSLFHSLPFLNRKCSSVPLLLLFPPRSHFPILSSAGVQLKLCSQHSWARGLSLHVPSGTPVRITFLPLSGPLYSHSVFLFLLIHSILRLSSLFILKRLRKKNWD